VLEVEGPDACGIPEMDAGVRPDPESDRFRVSTILDHRTNFGNALGDYWSTKSLGADGLTGKQTSSLYVGIEE